MTRIYLDYNATAPLRPQAVEAMQKCMLAPLNASSIHEEGRRARSLLETARRGIADRIGAFPAEVIFTASGTESNHWVFAAFAGRPFFVSAVEHSSVMKAATGATLLPVDANGVLDMEKLAVLLPQESGFLVSVMLANNETGAIQPIADVAALVHARGGLLHCDGAQALGKIPVDMSSLGCDMLTLCAHKMGGPIGAAALVVSGKLPIAPLMLGGGQELNRRAGTENVAAIAGFAAAVVASSENELQSLRVWLDAFEAKAAEHGAVVLSSNVRRLPNTSCITMPKITSQTQIMRFDLVGISISAGAACTSGKVAGSATLKAMKVLQEHSACAIRISGGWGTTPLEIEAFTRQWLEMAV